MEFLPQPLPHNNYIMAMNETFCRYIRHLPHDELCEFTNEIDGCRELVLYFDYLNLIFCKMPRHEYSYAVGVFVLLAFILCFMLGIICNTIFNIAPNVISLARLLNYEEYTAGAVLIGVICGSPAAIARIFQNEGDTILMYNKILGGTLFLVGFCFGLQAIMHPLKLHGAFYLRDSIFLVAAYFALIFKLKSMRVYHYEALLFMATYFLYLLFILFQYLYYKLMKRARVHKVNAETGETKNDKLPQKKISSPFKRFRERFEISEEFDIEAEESQPNKEIFKQFLKSINPITNVLASEEKYLFAFHTVTVPIRFILKLIIPVVDYRVPLHGWSKLLNCIQLVILTIFVTIFSTNNYKYLLYAFGGALILSILTFLTTRTDRPPKFHVIFAVIGLLGSSTVSYIIISEFVSILYNFGTVIGIRRSILGLTLLSWGKSMGDLVLNLILARMGYIKMAVGAYYGAPIFNTLMGFGISFAVRCSGQNDPCKHLRKGEVGPTTGIFLLITLLSSIFFITATGFQVRKSLGYFTIILYALFIVFMVLTHMDIVHPHGSDHIGYEDTGALWA